MAIKISKSAVLDFNGNKTETSEITVRCDAPKCTDTVTWTEEKPDEIPDSVFKIIVFKDGIQTPDKHFFTEQCLRYYLRDVYHPPDSPRELAAKMQSSPAASRLADEHKAVVDSLPVKTDSMSDEYPKRSLQESAVGQPDPQETSVAEHGEVIASAV